MKELILITFTLIHFLVSAQETTLKFQLEKKEVFEKVEFIGVDNFDYHYSLKENTITKIGRSKIYEYNNIQLGNVFSVDMTNALKVVVFYKDQNTVVILDNTLSEIAQINFNLLNDFRKINYASSAFDNNIWLYNELTQELELFDFIEIKTKTRTVPIKDNPIFQGSNYNYCWLGTNTNIFCINPYGSIVIELTNSSYESIALFKNNLLLLKENKLHYLSQNNVLSEIEIPEEINIEDFSINNETLYIYDGDYLHHLKLIKP